MTDPREAIAQTEKRLAEVEALQLTLKETQLELNAYADLLRQKLAVLALPEPEKRPKRPALADFAFPTESGEAAAEQAPAAAGEEAPPKERRREPRRKGNPVSVQVSNSTATTEPFQGWVVDRSSGGLRLLVDQEIKPGSVLNVRPTKVHPGFPWMQVKVKSCRPERSSYNLGCQFLRKLSWTELQTFG